MKKIFLSLFFIFSLNAHAQWPKSVIESLESHFVHTASISDPIVATFWGGFKRYLHWPSNKGEMINLKSDLFSKGEIQVYFSKQKIENAPLIIFMPGVFGQPQRGLTPLFIEYFESFGAHVLVVPNILSSMYIEAYPLYQENPSLTEVQVMEKVLDEIEQIIPKKTKTYVVAESLGSAVASAWTSFDRRHKNRIHDLTLLWPPLSLHSAMKNFDKYFMAFEKKECSSFSKISVMLEKFLFSTFPSSLSKEEVRCSGEILLQDGFLKMMNLSFDSYLNAKGKIEEKKELKSFESFFRAYRDEVWIALEKRSPELRLEFWFTDIRKDKSFPVRILTSKNDFLNFEESWHDFKTKFNLSDEEVVILNWGGHSGPAGLNEFKNYLKSAMKL